MNADIIAALCDVLNQDTEFLALVGGARAFGSELPKSETSLMPRKAVRLEPSGGASLTANSYVLHDTQRVDAFCYGETPYQAGQVRLTVASTFKALRRQVAASTLIHWIAPAGGFADLRDRQARWPIAFQSFQVFFAETTIAA